jgi:small neutral amino acid transporter SnatA (MarC family)
MAQKTDSLAFRFAVVLALAVIVLLVTTWAAPILRTIRHRSRVATRFIGLNI